MLITNEDPITRKDIFFVIVAPIVVVAATKIIEFMVDKFQEQHETKTKKSPRKK